MKCVNSSLAEFSINDSNIIDLIESIKNLSYMQKDLERVKDTNMEEFVRFCLTCDIQEERIK